MAEPHQLYKPFDKQLEFELAVHSCKYNFILYGGAIRGGKTYSMLSIFVGLCRLFPGSRWVIVRESLPMLRMHVFPVFNKIVPSNFVAKMPSSANNWTCTFNNGSEMVFFSENYDADKDLERFKGLECDGFGAEEISGLNRATFFKMFERAGTWRMDERKRAKDDGLPTPPRVILATCNPTQNWVKDEIYNKWKLGELPDNWLYISSKVYDNPHIDVDWINGLKISMPPIQFQRFVDGDWDATENDRAWAYEFDYIKHVYEKDITIDENLPVWVSFDFNNNPTTCLIAQGTDEWCYVIEELEVNNGGTEQLCNLVKSKYHQYHLMITGDASGRKGSTNSHKNDYAIIKEVLELPDSRFKVRPKNRALTESQTLCNSFLFRFPEFQVSAPNCKTLIKELRMCKISDKGKGQFVKDRVDNKMDHFDCWRYLIDAMFPDFIANWQRYLN